jgi:hypothetical protein
MAFQSTWLPVMLVTSFENSKQFSLAKFIRKSVLRLLLVIARFGISPALFCQTILSVYLEESHQQRALE